MNTYCPNCHMPLVCVSGGVRITRVRFRGLCGNCKTHVAVDRERR